MFKESHKEISEEDLLTQLQTDCILQELFNDYLTLQIFTVQPDVTSLFSNPSNFSSTSSVTNTNSTSHLERKKKSLSNFIAIHRLSYFKYSKHYREYKFFSKLLYEKEKEKTLKNYSESNQKPSGYIIRSSSCKEKISLPPINKDNQKLTRSRSAMDVEAVNNNENNSATPALQRRSESVLEFCSPQEVEYSKEDLAIRSEKQLEWSHLKTIASMKFFLNFLLQNMNTSGILLVLWMKIEMWKDVYYLNDQVSVKERKVQLFRLMHEKLKKHLTTHVKNLIKEAVSDDILALRIFHRAQLDIMGRLKSYWLPRFLLHYNTTKRKSMDDNFEPTRTMTSLGIFPSVSFAKSLPFNGETLKYKIKKFDDVVKFNNERWKSGKFRTETRASLGESRVLIDALNVDKDAGYPFTSWLTVTYPKLDHMVLFWLDLDEYIKDFYLLNDQTLKLCYLWKIYHNYIDVDTELASSEEIMKIHSSLKTLKDLTKESVYKIFQDAMKKALSFIQVYWVEYCKLDESNFTRSCTTAPPPSSTHSSILQKRRELLSGSLPRTSVLSNQKPLKSKKHDGGSVKKTVEKINIADNACGDVTSDDDEDGGINEEDDDFIDHIEDGVKMSQFKSYIQNEEGRLTMNDLLLYLEVEIYYAIGRGKSTQKEQSAMAIYHTYFDAVSRRAANLPETFVKDVSNERPTTPTLREAQQHVLPQLAQSYKNFYTKIKKYQPEPETIISPRKVSKMSTSDVRIKKRIKKSKQAEVKPDKPATQLDPAAIKVKVGRKRRDGYRAPVTKKNKQSFLSLLTSNNPITVLQLDVFRRHLIKCEGNGFPRLDKDLLFCIEVVKYKDLFNFMDELSLNKKIEVIVDVFLDSASPPWLQIDIPPEMASKISQRFQQFHSKSRDPVVKDALIFDEAFKLVMKELLPFWSGYQQQLGAFNWNDITVKLTKAERKQRRLYNEFLKYIPMSDPIIAQPSTPATDSHHEAVPKRTISFTIKNGCQWREIQQNRWKIQRKHTLSNNPVS